MIRCLATGMPCNMFSGGIGIFLSHAAATKRLMMITDTMLPSNRLPTQKIIKTILALTLMADFSGRQ